MSFLPTHLGGIPVWAILISLTALILFFLKTSSSPTNQDSYPTARLFLYIGTIFIGIAAVADFIRWANLW